MIKQKSKKVKKLAGMINEESNESSSETENNVASKPSKQNKKASIGKMLAKKNSLKLHKIVLENFKSFEGVHEIGYFLNFSVVLGPNGSGKSNIIDAICFALGMRTISLRTKNLKDLIYKREFDDDNIRKSAYVELFLEKDGANITFKRTITPKGSSDFFINGSKISVDKYLKELQDLDIPSKARYFILVQGAIDTILSKKNDLTETIELLSGSSEYKEDYERVKSEIQNLNNEITKLSTEMHSIKDDRNRVKVQIENEEKYNDLVSKLNTLLNKIYLYQLAEMDSLIKTSEHNLEENEISLKQVQEEKREVIELIKANEIEIRKLENDLKKDDHEVNSYRTKVEASKIKLEQCVENIKLYESQIFSKMSMLNQHKNEKKKKDEKKAVLKSQVEAVISEINEIKSKLEGADHNIPNNLEKSQIEEYREISNKVHIETFQMSRDKEKIQNQLSELSNQKTIFEKNLIKLENEKNALEGELKLNLEKCEKEQQSVEKLEKENNVDKNKLISKDNEKLQFENDFTNANKVLNDKLAQLSLFESENFENSKRKKISEFMNKNSQVYGFLYELITPLQKKHEIPIKVSLIKYLNYLVVQDSATAKLCSDFLKSKEISADVLVLENIPEKESDESVRLRLGSNLGILVVDLIDFKKKGLKNALNYFLKDMVMCYEKENVAKLKQSGFNSIILTDGTLYKKGTITGGNYKSLDQFSFNYKGNNPAEIAKLQLEIENLSKQVQSLEEKRSDYKELYMLKNKIIEKENMIEIVKKNYFLFNENAEKAKFSIQKKDDLINQITNSIGKIDSEYLTLLTALEEINKKKNILKEQMFSDFIKKNRLSSLQDFEPYSLSEFKRLSEELKNLDERLSKLKSQIISLEAHDELIHKLENSLHEDKEKKKSFEKEKETFEWSYKSILQDFENFKESKNEEYKKLNQIKEHLKSKQSDIDRLDKRNRQLLKNKIEFEHNVTTSIEKKKNIIEESKLNIDSYLKKLCNLGDNYPVFVSLNVQLERYIIAHENKFQKTDLVIDYTDLESKSKINDRTADGIKDKIKSAKNKFTNFMKELEKYVKLCTLNEEEANKLKDKEGELARKKKNLSLQVETLVTDLDQKKAEFEKIRANRKELFDEFFKKLSAKLTNVYKDLTKPQNSINPGGSAYIYNTNEDEPYLGTVCYLPTPPGKRVIYDIDQLSGGEKTIAILGLVISLQTICETPFIILDEIDSYLDPEHEAILENLFKATNRNYQIILVTHKSNIFRSAQSLIGTYFNKQRFSSVPISVDLTKIY